MITASGLATGLDVDSIVSQLVQAEKAPAVQRLAAREARIGAQISALGSVRSAMATLEDSLEALKADALRAAFRAESSSPEHFSASATATAAPGSYTVEVVALASAHKLASGAFADASASVGTGTLEVLLGADSFQVQIDAGADSLTAIRDAINDAPDNVGVQATIINESGGSRLVLTAQQTGAANTITVRASGGDGGLQQLVYDPGVLENLVELQAAGDAQARIEGFLVTAPSNTIDGAIDGISLSLQQADPGVQHTLTVRRDTGAAVQGLKDFASAYNGVLDAIDRATAYNATTGSAAALLGDAGMRTLAGRLRELVYGSYPGADGVPVALTAVGLTFDGSGRLQVDEAAVAEALEADPEQFTTVLDGSSGLRAAFASLTEAWNGPGGLFESRSESLDASLERINAERERLDARMATIEARYRRQFTALEKLVSSLNQTGTFLAQQLQQLQSLNSRES